VGKVLVGEIMGPQGPQGETGPPGATGVNVIFDGTNWVPQTGAANYVSDTDPGAVADGSIWFDTS
jgi:hypothetical protein